jgi:hypothetical protein
MKNILMALGLGTVIWAVMFAVVSAFLPWYEQVWMKVVLVVIVGGLAYAAAVYANITDTNRGLLYGALFVLVALLLDALVTARFNPNIFNEIYLWLGYALTLFAPILRALRVK